MTRRPIFSRKMHVGYEYLRRHVRLDAVGRLIGEDARGLLNQCLNGNGYYVYGTFQEARNNVISVFPPQRPNSKQAFQLHVVDYEIRERRPPGRCNRVEVARPRPSTRMISEMVELLPPDPISLDFTELAKPVNRLLLQYLINFQRDIPSVALDMVREGLERMQRVNAAGWTITLVDGRPQRRLYDPSQDHPMLKT